MASHSVPPKNDPLSKALARIRDMDDEDGQLKALLTQCMMQHSMFSTVLYFLEANGAKALSKMFADSVKGNAADLMTKDPTMAKVATMAAEYVEGVVAVTVPHIRKHHPLDEGPDKTARGVANLEQLTKVLTISVLSGTPRNILRAIQDEPPIDTVNNIIQLMSSIMAAWQNDDTREYYESVIRPTIRATTMSYVKRKREMGAL